MLISSQIIISSYPISHPLESCPNLPFVPHLVVEVMNSPVPDEYATGTVLSLRCEVGYSLTGSNVIMCNDSGEIQFITVIII